MSDYERILIECRYLLSLNRGYNYLSDRLNISVDTVYDDLNNKLKEYDTILYQRIQNVLKKINNI